MAADKKVSGKRFDLSIPENDSESSKFTDLTAIFENGGDPDANEYDKPVLASLPNDIKNDRRKSPPKGGRRKSDRRAGGDRTIRSGAGRSPDSMAAMANFRNRRAYCQ